MLLSSEHCNIQEMAQRVRAENDPLPNVRLLAAKAADAWHIEGLFALKREKRHLMAGQGGGLPEDDMSGPDPDEYVSEER
jgi:hypothetical protein